MIPEEEVLPTGIESLDLTDRSSSIFKTEDILKATVNASSLENKWKHPNNETERNGFLF